MDNIKGLYELRFGNTSTSLKDWIQPRSKFDIQFARESLIKALVQICRLVESDRVPLNLNLASIKISNESSHVKLVGIALKALPSVTRQELLQRYGHYNLGPDFKLTLNDLGAAPDRKEVMHLLVNHVVM